MIAKGEMWQHLDFALWNIHKSPVGSDLAYLFREIVSTSNLIFVGHLFRPFRPLTTLTTAFITIAIYLTLFRTAFPYEDTPASSGATGHGFFAFTIALSSPIH